MNYEVEKVREKLIRQGWPKFLNWVKIEGLRGWNGEKIEFKFPVCVIAGENGSGKSTVLQVAAAAYNNPRGKKYTYYPSSFFPDTAWEIVSNAHLEFEIKEGENTFVYRVNKSQKKWRFKPQDRKPERYVVWQDISRTLPLSSTAGYAALAKRTAQEIRSERVNVVADLSEIMGREYDGAMLAVGQYGKTQKPVGVVKIRDKDISQFHQGAGEDATFDLLNTLEKIPAGALLLIDEIEASLHPRAQRKLVHFLLRLARKKYVQVILSSHSPFVLEELPSEARILLMRGADSVDVLYGVSPSFALTKMDDKKVPDFYILTEDKRASTLVNALLKRGGIQQAWECVDVGSSEILRQIARAKRLPFKYVCVVDGDNDVDGQSLENLVKMPGIFAPERQIFSDIKDKERALDIFAQRLDLAPRSVAAELERIMSNQDHHVWPKKAADIFSVSEGYLWEMACYVWVKHCLDEDSLSEFIDKIEKYCFGVRHA